MSYIHLLIDPTASVAANKRAVLMTEMTVCYPEYPCLPGAGPVQHQETEGDQIATPGVGNKQFSGKIWLRNTVREGFATNFIIFCL